MEPLPLLVSFPPRAKQRRWTVLLRIFMVIPLAFVLLFVGIATLVVVFIGWFGALFTGRTPQFTRDLVTIFLRLYVRLQAYASLMTDQFPAFSFEETPTDPTRVAVPNATTMNRWAVFFRVILFIPVYVLAAVVVSGLAVIQVVMWFVVLITGWLPAPVHDAYGAVFRYTNRYAAYTYLLVPTYPWGLFGDRPSLTGSIATDTNLVPGTSLEQPPSPQPWDIVIGRGAKWVVAVAIVLGVPSFIASRALDYRHSAAYQHQQLVNANNNLVSQISQFSSNGKTCRSRTDEVSCLEQNDHTIAEQLTTFADTLEGNANAGIDHGVINTATSDAQSLAGLFYLAANAGPTRADYDRTANQVKLDQAALQMERSLGALQHALNDS
jgi:hypothetical protein